jgi:hypothetical protein
MGISRRDRQQHGRRGGTRIDDFKGCPHHVAGVKHYSLPSSRTQFHAECIRCGTTGLFKFGNDIGADAAGSRRTAPLVATLSLDASKEVLSRHGD